ncbi:hypothetical protein LCGC14_2617030, partial [marine sediment metagenome]
GDSLLILDSLEVRGAGWLGGATNYAKIDSSGNFKHFGTSKFLNLTWDIETFTTDDTLDAENVTVLLDGSSNSVTASLPTAVGIVGRVYYIKSIDATNTTDINPNVSKIIDGEVVAVGKTQSEKIWNELKDNGYIDEEGNITSKFNPKDRDFELVISAEHDEIKPAIIDTIKSYQFEGHIVDKRSRKSVRLKKKVLLDDNFKTLWEKISQKTTYSVEYDTQKLIESVTEVIKQMETIEAIKIQTTKVEVDVTKAGVVTQEILHRTTKTEIKHKLPDILAYLQKETELTRSTLAEILISSGRLGDFIKNPQLFIDNVTKCINRELHRIMIEGIKYEKIDGEMYEMRLFQEEVLAYLHNLIEVQHSVYDHVEYDSEVERKFAKDLDSMEEVKLFVKLPAWFKVETPIGSYNPDWAIVKHGDETLYLVRETKSTRDKDKLRKAESDKITCGEKHFEELKVDFKV